MAVFAKTTILSTASTLRQLGSKNTSQLQLHCPFLNLSTSAG